MAALGRRLASSAARASSAAAYGRAGRARRSADGLCSQGLMSAAPPCALGPVPSAKTRENRGGGGGVSNGIRSVMVEISDCWSVPQPAALQHSLTNAPTAPTRGERHAIPPCVIGALSPARARRWTLVSHSPPRSRAGVSPEGKSPTSGQPSRCCPPTPATSWPRPCAGTSTGLGQGRLSPPVRPCSGPCKPTASRPCHRSASRCSAPGTHRLGPGRPSPTPKPPIVADLRPPRPLRIETVATQHDAHLWSAFTDVTTAVATDRVPSGGRGADHRRDRSWRYSLREHRSRDLGLKPLDDTNRPSPCASTGPLGLKPLDDFSLREHRSRDRPEAVGRHQPGFSLREHLRPRPEAVGRRTGLLLARAQVPRPRSRWTTPTGLLLARA